MGNVTLEKTKKKPLLEKAIQKKIVDYLNSIPGCSADVITVARFGVPGMSDIIFCWKGKYGALEIKRPGKKATPIQIHWLNGKKKCGAITGVATSVEDTKKILLDIDARI